MVNLVALVISTVDTLLIDLNMFSHTHTCMYVHVHTHISVCICMYVHIYMRIASVFVYKSIQFY